MDSFYLNKWYLDFVDEQGRAMIFYSAQLTWYGITLRYGSWLDASPRSPVKLRQGFHGVCMPTLDGESITFSHKRYRVSGIWESKVKDGGLEARIIDLPQGHLDWHCYQPASEIVLKIDGIEMTGKGYAEQLILTIPPWKIPMKNLRWGRFVSQDYNVVWIQVDLIEKEKWLWLNGERQYNVEINDDQIQLPGIGILLNLDKYQVLESEKKINSLVEKLVKYIPGFKRAIPTQFLMADEYKWLSHGKIIGPGFVADGMAIHEYVNFQ